FSRVVNGALTADGVYGGAEADSGSGTLQYVTVRHAGAEPITDLGFNVGLTLGGVGTGTTVDHIQVHNSSGDGLAFLGGTVNADYLVLSGSDGNQLDIDRGYTGTVDRMVVVPRAGDISGNGIDVSGDSASRPRIIRFTLLAGDSTGGSGIRLSGGARPGFTDGIVVHGNTCIDYEATAGDGRQAISFSEDPALETSLYDCGVGLLTMDTGNGDDPVAGQAVFDDTFSNVEAGNTLDGFIPGAAEGRVNAGAPPRLHIGAFNPAEETNTDNWATGWTRDVLSGLSCPEGTADAGFDIFGQNVCNVSGTVTDELTLTRGHLYALLGRVDIGVDVGILAAAPSGAAAELIIDPGVTVFGRSGADYIVVNRDSAITAEGTVDDPIIFTSEEDVTNARDARGEWGGLVILGHGPINACNVPAIGRDYCENAIRSVAGVPALYGGTGRSGSAGLVVPIDEPPTSLSHVQVRYAGSGLGAGITLGGADAHVVLDRVQVHNSSGDGIKYLGGRPISRRIVVTGSGDDQLDFDQGYGGLTQYLVTVQRSGDSSGDSIEVSSGRQGVTPQTAPFVGNFTLIGAGTGGHGIRLDTYAAGRYHNGVVVDTDTCVDYRDTAGDGMEGFTPGFDPEFRSVLFDCEDGVFSSGSDTTTGRAAISNDVVGVRNNSFATNTLSDVFVNGTAEAAVPATPAPPNSGDDTDYIGAVRASDTWWQGWTCGLGVDGSPPC
ncbi:MAG: hypothetical protein GDA39_04800, partial [Hyphomonadaceae bacterium]|nr:hypothetical protein [Hyphomonadaceae bacterium]